MTENQPRGEGGEFGVKVTEQDVLLVFDATDDPFLTASEIAEQLPVTRQGVYHRLKQMREKGLVDKKKTGARGAGWWATIAPRLAPGVAERAEAADRGDAVTLEELDAELDTA